MVVLEKIKLTHNFWSIGILDLKPHESSSSYDFFEAFILCRNHLNKINGNYEKGSVTPKNKKVWSHDIRDP